MAFNAGHWWNSSRRILGRMLPQTAKKTLPRLTVDGEEIQEPAPDTADSRRSERPGMQRLLDLLQTPWERETPYGRITGDH
jgi:hypothetical protein